jgi:hypothetical protein
MRLVKRPVRRVRATKRYVASSVPLPKSKRGNDSLRNDCGAPHKARFAAGALSVQVTPSGRPAKQRGNAMSAHCGVHAPRRRRAPAPPASTPTPIRPLLA